MADQVPAEQLLQGEVPVVDHRPIGHTAKPNLYFFDINKDKAS
jgi:hypothetical protein